MPQTAYKSEEEGQASGGQGTGIRHVVVIVVVIVDVVVLVDLLVHVLVLVDVVVDGSFSTPPQAAMHYNL